MFDYTQRLAVKNDDFEIDKDHHEIHLVFNQDEYSRVTDTFGNENINIAENNEINVHISMPVNSWIKEFILSFGSGVKVLSPDFLREHIRDEIKKASALYS